MIPELTTALCAARGRAMLWGTLVLKLQQRCTEAVAAGDWPEATRLALRARHAAARRDEAWALVTDRRESLEELVCRTPPPQ